MSERTRELLEDLQTDLEALRSQLVSLRRLGGESAQLAALDLQAARVLQRVSQVRRPEPVSFRR